MVVQFIHFCFWLLTKATNSFYKFEFKLEINWIILILYICGCDKMELMRENQICDFVKDI